MVARRTLGRMQMIIRPCGASWIRTENKGVTLSQVTIFNGTQQVYQSNYVISGSAANRIQRTEVALLSAAAVGTAASTVLLKLSRSFAAACAIPYRLSSSCSAAVY